MIHCVEIKYISVAYHFLQLVSAVLLSVFVWLKLCEFDTDGCCG